MKHEFFALRFTPYPQPASLEEATQPRDMIDLFSPYSDYEFSISLERATNIHYHAVFAYDELDKEEFRDWLYLTFHIPIESRGNSCYSLKPILSEEQIAQAYEYAFKDGNFASSNLSPNDIADYYNPEAMSGQSYSTQFSALWEKDLTTVQFLFNLINLRVTFKLPVSKTSIVDTARSYSLSKDYTSVADLVLELESKI